MRIIILFLLTSLLLPTAGTAEYEIHSLGARISNDEILIDSSANGWVLVRDGDHKKGCPNRLNLNTKQVDKLCEMGLKSAVAINKRGHVLGTNKTNRLIIWKGRSSKRILKNPPSYYKHVSLTDLNDKDIAVGFATHIEESPDNYEEKSASFRWNKNGGYKQLLPPEGYENASIFVWNINNRGEIVTQVAPDGPYRVYLRQRNGSFSLISSEIYNNNFALNDRGQVSINSYIDYLYTPDSGLREVVSNPNNNCSRCDYEAYSALANDGRAIFHDGSALTLSDYPHPAIPLTCLIPQNRKIGGTNRLVSDLDISSLQLAKFLDNKRIIFSADIEGDGKEQQLFIMKKSSALEDGIYNYCIDISILNEAVPNSNCSDIDSPNRLINCQGSITLNSFGSVLPPISISLMATQLKDSSNISCPENLINSYQTTNLENKINFNEKFDPGFSYYFLIDDPRFTLNGYNVAFTPYSEVQTPILPCRAPFEGL